MPNHKQLFLLLSLCFSSGLLQANERTGQQLALDPSKGNCHACHNLLGAESSGNIGPTIQGMLQKFPDIKDLQAFIRDPAIKNPNTIMPPFGRHQILSEDEIIEISKFIHTL